MPSGDGSQAGPTTFVTVLRSLLEGAGKVLGAVVAGWVVWDNVRGACRETRLYAPFDAAGWAAIADPAARASASTEAVILRVYAPGGPGYATLVTELRTARLLAEQQLQVREVLASLDDGRAYVAICGTLPLIEGVLTRANGSWRRVDAYQLEERLNRMEGRDQADYAGLLVDAAAVAMVCSAIPEVWKSGRHTVDAITSQLKRHPALHGTASGWETPENAVRALLLLAAAARVAGPLLGSEPPVSRQPPALDLGPSEPAAGLHPGVASPARSASEAPASSSLAANGAHPILGRMAP